MTGIGISTFLSSVDFTGAKALIGLALFFPIQIVNLNFTIYQNCARNIFNYLDVDMIKDVKFSRDKKTVIVEFSK